MRRIVAIACALLLVLGPELAQARPARKSPDAELNEIVHRAESLLNKLEYERARELLEATVRDSQFKKAKPVSKARLWALLGRARAEQGDPVGTDEAFLQAVQWDHKVKLPKDTSPKILEALERARANAPVPGERASDTPEPRREKVERTARSEPITESAKRAPSGGQTHPAASSRDAGAAIASGSDAGVVDSGAARADGGSAAAVSAWSADAGASSGAITSAPSDGGNRSTDAGASISSGGPVDGGSVASTLRDAGSSDGRAAPASGGDASSVGAIASAAGSAREDAATPAPHDAGPSAPAATNKDAGALGDHLDASSSSDAGTPAAPDASAPSRDAGSAKDGGVEAARTASTESAHAVDATPTVPTVRTRVEGRVALGKTVTVVVETFKLPKGARLELSVRDSETGPFKPMPLTKTGTLSVRKLRLDQPRYELYVRAFKGKKLIAEAGSEQEPRVITALTSPPSIDEAWAEQPKKTSSSEPPSLARQMAELEKAEPDRPQPALTTTTSVAPASASAAKTKTSTAPSARLVAPPEDDDSTPLIIGLAAAGVAVVAGTIVLVVLLTKKSDCNTREGLGCAQIQVRPLVSF
jgi:hypothetical protein